MGWLTGKLILTSGGDELIPMAPSTALSFVLMGTAVTWRCLAPASVKAKAWTWFAAAIALGLCVLSLGQNLGMHVELRFLFPKVGSRLGQFPIGVMSPITVASFVIFAGALVLQMMPERRILVGTSVAGALLAAGVGLVVVIGYLFGTPLLYGGGAVIPLALTTGLGMSLLGVALTLNAGSSFWPVSLFARASVEARLLRAFLPLTAGLVLLVGWLAVMVASTRSGNPALWAVALAALSVGAVSVIVAKVARSIGGIIERSEAERLRQQARADMIINAAGEGITGLNTDGEMTLVNPAAAKMLGWEPHDLLGKTQHALIHHSKPGGATYPREECPIYAAFKDGVTRQVADEVFWRRDGTSFPVEYVSTPIREQGRVVGAVVTFRDVSEQRKLEEQFRQSQKMEAIGQLAGGVAHDFNNLLAVILSNSRFVRDDLGSAHPSYEDIVEVERAAQKAAALTKKLLSFSRKQVLDMEVLDVNEVVADSLKMLRRLVPENIDLSAALGKDVGKARTDRGQVDQALLNLVVNARDAMPNGGKLTIETAPVELDESYARGRIGTRPGHYVMLAVSDTGIGMDAETQSKIFLPFFTTKPVGRGTGLGLAMVHGFVKQSGGEILVYSAPGKGATFKMYLPRVVDADEVGLPAGTAATSVTGSETVLVVEDEEAVRTVAIRTLTRAGYKVLSAGDPEEALRLSNATEAPIHLLLSDVIMPKIDGPSMAQRLKVGRSDLKVLFMSGYTGGALVHQGLLEPGIGYLQKPFTPESLLAKVRAVLES